MGTNKECRKIKELIMEAVDGLPEKNLENKVNNHVSGCADCAKYREELLKIKSALADFPYKQPAYLEAKILNGVINDEMAEKPVGRSIFKAPVFAYGALFAVLVIASFFYIYNSAGIGEITEQPVIAAGGPETEAAAATEAAAKAPEKEMIEIAVTEPGIRIVEAEKTAPVRASSAPVFNNERTIITAQEPAGRQAAPHRVAEVPYTSAGVAAAKMTPVEVPGGNELLDADGAIVANNMVNP
ncbi:MAG TPA: zf-HC2 domain-containing protein, partial [bacterium]|nr:zf-HC2 domain-containing protein [bacterium]